MKKVVTRIFLTMLIIAMAISVFVACEIKDTYSVSFVDVDDSGSTTDAMTVAQAQEYLKSLPTRDGYVFKGWYLDKDTWEQKIESTEDIEKYIVSGNVNVYARWVAIENAITILFLDYNKASLLEYKCDRADANLNFLKPSAKPDDEKYTYTFDHWDCDMSDLTQPFYKATPVYTANLRVFEVTYYNERELIYTEKVEYGKDAKTYRIEPDRKESDAKYDYTFAGWEGNATNVTSDVQLRAQWQATLRKYDVTFIYGDNKTVTRKVNYDASALSVAPTDTKKTSSAEYEYTFNCWLAEDGKSLNNVQSNTTVRADYIEKKRTYTVSFYADDKLISWESVPYGGSVENPPTDIVTDLYDGRVVDGYICSFNGWQGSFVNVKSDTKIYANIDKQAQKFTVKYLDQNGDELYTHTVETGEASVYPYENPSIENTAKYIYTFLGWSNAEKLNDVRADLVAQAQFRQDIREYTVTFKYGDGLTHSRIVEYGQSATAPTTKLEKTNTAQFKYEFIGWDKNFTNIQSDLTVNAVYDEKIQQYEVSFWISEDSNDVKDCIQSSFVKYGDSATAPTKVVKNADDGFAYTFLNWDKSFDNIQADTRVNAIFDKQSQTFEITYEEWNGKILYVERLETGETSTYKGTEQPHRESNPQYEYEFIGWSNEEKLTRVTETIAVRAQYKEKERTYTVTFDYGYDKEPVVMTGVAYGTNLLGQEPTDTDREATVANTFSFLGWVGNLGYIYEDTTITARWAETLRKYLVKFIVNGITVSEQEVGYGYCPTNPNISTMSSTPKFDYDALGWGISNANFKEGQFVDFDDADYDENGFVAIDVANTKVNEDTLVDEQIVYTAIYLRTIREYLITFFNEHILGERKQVAQIKVKYGSDATALAPTDAESVEREATVSTVYTFNGWTKDLSCIISDIEVDAKYLDDLRPYSVIYYDIVLDNDGEVVYDENGEPLYEEYYRETVKYSKGVVNKPSNPIRRSTVGYDFTFENWTKYNEDNNGMFSDVNNVLGDTAVYASYTGKKRWYKVTFFDLSVYELIITTELEYETKIERIIEREGYDFDAWYRDPDCTDMFNTDTQFVDGIMMLFGNTVVSGLDYSGSVVTGYHGTLADVILPRVIKGTKMTEVKSNAFEGNEVMETVYIPNTYKKVNSFVFKDIKELDIYTEAVNGALLDYPYGWSPYWNNNSVLVGTNDSRTVTNNVENVVTQGDYRYMLVGGKDTAIISKFVNNNAARAYIQATLDYQNPSFNSVLHTDEKTGQQRYIYEIEYESKIYNISTISSSAFSGCENLGNVFIPNTITTVKKYAFSGISVSIYIQHDKKPSGWNGDWSKNRDATLINEGTGHKDIYWGTIGMDRIGDFSYIFMNDNTAVVSEYYGGASLTTITIPSYVDYTPNAAEEKTTYTVTELGASLFEASLISLGDVNKITLPEKLTKIGKKVFYMNKRIKAIELPDTLTTIDDYAFTGTTGLEEIFIPAGIQKIGSFCFVGSNATIYLACSKPATLLNKPSLGTYWNSRVDMSTVTDLDISKIAGMIFGADKLPTYWEVAGKTIVTAKGTGLSAGISIDFTYILRSNGTAYLAAYKNTGLIQLPEYIIPETLEYNGATYTVNEIGEGALSGEKYLSSIYIPKTVTKIGASAFSGCSNLTINTAWEESEKPSGWDDSFNPDNRTVNWGVVK